MYQLQKKLGGCLFFVAFLLLFAGFSQVNAAENILGDWVFTMDLGDMGGMGGGGGMTMTINSTFTKGDDGKITGTWVMNFNAPEGTQGGPGGFGGGPGGGDFQMPTFKIVDVNIDGQKLSFTRKAEGGDAGGMGGMMMEDRKFSGTIKGDTIELTSSSNFGEMTYKGTRKAAAAPAITAASAAGLEGDWVFTMSIPDNGMGMGPMEFTINSKITKDPNGKYAMTWDQQMTPPPGGGDFGGPGGGGFPSPQVKIENIKLDGDKLTFTQKVSFGDMGGMGGGEMVSNFVGTLKDDTIDGKLTSADNGMGMGPMEFTLKGKKKAAEKPAVATATAPAGLEGDWEFVTTFGDMGMELRANVNFKKDADGKYSCTWKGIPMEGMGGPGGAGAMPQPTVTISDIKLDGDKVTFVQKVDLSAMQMGEMTSNYSGTLKGDKIDGAFTSDMGESKSIGIRKKAAETPVSAVSAGSDPLLGDWQFTMSFGGGDGGMGNREFIINSTFTKKDDGTYAATWERQVTEGQRGFGGGGGGFGGGEPPAVVIKDIKLNGNKLTFVQSINFNGQEMASNFSGTIENGKITGTMTSDMMGEMPITGIKKK